MSNDTSLTTPLEAYIASQPSLGWHDTAWDEDSKQWVTEVFSDPVVGHRAVDSAVRLYNTALGSPGYDFRLSWLPKLSDLLPCLVEDFDPLQMFQTLVEVGTVKQNTLPLRALIMVAPLPTEEVEERAERILSVGDPVYAEALQGLLSNPNAPAEMIEDLYGYITTELEAKKWTPLVSPKSLVAILRNPSVSPAFISEALSNLFTQDDFLMRNTVDSLSAIAWNPATPQEIISEFFSGGMTSSEAVAPKIRTSFPWRGNLSLEAQRKHQYSPRLAPMRLSKEQIANLQDIYLTNHQVRDWMGRPHSMDSSKLTGGHFLDAGYDPERFVKTVDRFYFDTDVSDARAAVFDSITKGEAKSINTVRYLTFCADRIRQRKELVEAFGDDANEVPSEWLDALL